jgi:hypothetical protein
MILTLAWVESLIFIALSIVHLNWAKGSSWGFEKSIPTTEEGKRVLNPTRKDSLIVGIGLLFFAFFYLIKAGEISIELPYWVLRIAGWLIPIIFIFRSVGDFKYIGFFKKITTTGFATNDSKLYAPLCLLLGINGIYLQLVL